MAIASYSPGAPNANALGFVMPQSQTQTFSSVPAAPATAQLNAASGQFTGAYRPGQTWNTKSNPGPGWVSTWNGTGDPFWTYVGGDKTYNATQYFTQKDINKLISANQKPASTGPALPGSRGGSASSAALPYSSGAASGGQQAPQAMPMAQSGVPTSTVSSGGGLPSISYGSATTPYAAPTGADAAIAQNPWSAASSLASQNAGMASAAQAGLNFGQANNLRSGSGQAINAGNQVLNTAFDPQNALYNRTLQQLQDQIRVGEAARGITMSPYGAGVENKALSDFNIDWQNQQLNRQAQGLGAYGSALQNAGGASSTGANLGQMGVSQVQGQGQIPWDTYNQQQQQNIANWIAYMNQANAATQNAMQNYPNQLSQISMQQAGGVPYIPSQQNFRLSI